MTIHDAPLPRVIRIEPAGVCNLRCTHCPTGQSTHPQGVPMGWALFEKIAGEIQCHRDAVKVVVLYHGGEPLLNRSFFDMASRIRAIGPGFHIKTVSNGMAMDARKAEALVQSGLDCVEFSLDGASPSENEKIRKGCDTQAVVRNIRLLLRARRERASERPRVVITTTQFVQSVEAPFPLPDPSAPEWIRSLFPPGEVDFKANYAVAWPRMPASGQYDRLADPGARDSNFCDHLVNTMTIRADGTVVPCCYDLTGELPMGSVLHQAMAEIWHSDKYSRLRMDVSEKRYPPLCASCSVVRPATYLIPRKGFLA